MCNMLNIFLTESGGRKVQVISVGVCTVKMNRSSPASKLVRKQYSYHVIHASFDSALSTQHLLCHVPMYNIMPNSQNPF